MSITMIVAGCVLGVLCLAMIAVVFEWIGVAVRDYYRMWRQS